VLCILSVGTCIHIYQDKNNSRILVSELMNFTVFLHVAVNWSVLQCILHYSADTLACMHIHLDKKNWRNLVYECLVFRVLKFVEVCCSALQYGLFYTHIQDIHIYM